MICQIGRRRSRAPAIAKGIVYGTVGVLAVMAAFQGGGVQTTGTRSALLEIAEKPYGTAMLVRAP